MWTMFRKDVRTTVGASEDMVLLCGLAIGYEGREHEEADAIVGKAAGRGEPPRRREPRGARISGAPFARRAMSGQGVEDVPVGEGLKDAGGHEADASSGLELGAVEPPGVGRVVAGDHD